MRNEVCSFVDKADRFAGLRQQDLSVVEKPPTIAPIGAGSPPEKANLLPEVVIPCFLTAAMLLICASC
ncbi:hypothetical protein MES4922_130022 [Mesorhizobium ventifaucium]|uniref:Propionyl-coenzyme A carboxylase alpha polypeptide n=1 Tax=Mesorhizobium ventifaucium TaxID=666020 RepID=A0ABM9DG92_9HYPH|nr:hypothetical protein MES4922_130022 [Mesorhizobium ventifaucium]